MKHSIMGFDQEKLINIKNDKLKIDIDDVLILQWFLNAIGSSKMQHIQYDDGRPFVWAGMDKILQDLPILNISKNRLSHRLKKLRDLRLLDEKIISNDTNRGSKSYFGRTELFDSLLFNNEADVKNNNWSSLPDVKNNKSNNKLSKDNISNNKLLENYSNKNNSKELLENFDKGFLSNKPKQSKQDLYSKCINLIDGFTNDGTLRKKLTQYLDLLLEIYKDKNKSFYTNIWKGKLNKLKEICSISFNDKEQLFLVEDAIKVVQQSIEKGWESFYSITNNYNSNTYVDNMNSDKNNDNKEIKLSKEEF